jgi:GxxExxY protein
MLCRICRILSLGGSMKDEALTRSVIGCAFKVHNTLGSGFLEKVYQSALCIELRKLGLQVVEHEPIKVVYEGQIVGEYYADLLVEGRVIVEIKAVEDLVRAHEVQLVNYLSATGIDVGLLINFGPSVRVRRKYRDYVRPTQPPAQADIDIP